MKNSILFIKIGSFSNINTSLISQFKNYFSENNIEVLDVYEKIALKYIQSARNISYFIKEYGFDFLTLKKSRYIIWEWAFVTSYMFRLIQNEIQKYVRKNNYLFTFQTQSLFDGSTPGIPHFVYTDSTVLANLYYPDISIKSILKSKKWMKLEPQIYNNATLNFTFSSNQQKSLIEQYGINPAKIKCVYAGSNIKIGVKNLCDKKYYSKIILFVGVNWERKGGAVLLKAFQKVRKIHSDAKLYIVGCDKNLILKNNDQSDIENCIITGRISVEEVDKYFEQASLFCLPTCIEPFGIVFIEAMMHKLPIVASNIGAIPDMVTQGVNGFLHGIDNVDGIASSISALLDDPIQCKRMGAEGFNRAINNYTWENTVGLMKKYIEEKIYENCPF